MSNTPTPTAEERAREFFEKNYANTGTDWNTSDETALAALITQERAEAAERMRERAAVCVSGCWGMFTLPDPNAGPFRNQDHTISECQQIFAERIRALPLTETK